MLKNIMIMILFLFTIGFSTNYEIGTGKTYSDIEDFTGWLSLSAGDTVKIFYRATAYNSKIGIRSQGTASNPVVIMGVPDGNNYPTIDGNDAVTDSQFDGFWSSSVYSNLEQVAVICIVRDWDSDVFSYIPAWIEIKNLKITGAHWTNTYTNITGTDQDVGDDGYGGDDPSGLGDSDIDNYTRGAAAIYAYRINGLLVENCEITGNGNGVFTNTGGDYLTRNLIFRDCYFHENGNVGIDRQHHLYTESDSLLVEGCRFGRLRAGSNGATIKSRGINTVIRYNWMLPAAFGINLCDPENSYSLISLESGYQGNNYIYGNIFVNEYTGSYAFAGDLIQYGGDTGVTQYYRKGNLYFYNNTVIENVDSGDSWRTKLFTVQTNDETVHMYNNIIYVDGTTNFYLIADEGGILNVEEENWISSYSDYQSGFTGTVNTNDTPLTGSEPGFTDYDNDDFTLVASSTCINSAGTLPSVITTNNDVEGEYSIHRDVISRTSKNELGAFDYDSLIVVESLEVANIDSVWAN